MKARDAYLIGLKHFHSVLVSDYGKPGNQTEESFCDILYVGGKHFDIGKERINELVGPEKGFNSIWMWYGEFPNYETRQIVLDYILEKVNKQLYFFLKEIE